MNFEMVLTIFVACMGICHCSMCVKGSAFSCFVARTRQDLTSLLFTVFTFLAMTFTNY